MANKSAWEVPNLKQLTNKFSILKVHQPEKIPGLSTAQQKNTPQQTLFSVVMAHLLYF